MDNKKTVGEWTWNTEVLNRKIIETDADKCWSWTGSRGPQTNLFGAKKSGKAQMTQARRILYMDKTNIDCSDVRITMKCKNPYCMNFAHFDVKPNQRKYYDDGILRGQRPVIDPEQGLKRVKMKRIKAEWE